MNKNKEKKPVVSLTAKDFEFDFYNGSGNGGQNRNKVQAAVRCFHRPSGSMGKSEDERSQAQNKSLAFKRCCESKQFKNWIKLEHARRLGVLASAEAAARLEMFKTKIDVKDENGRWVTPKELQIKEQDLNNLEENDENS